MKKIVGGLVALALAGSVGGALLSTSEQAPGPIEIRVETDPARSVDIRVWHDSYRVICQRGPAVPEDWAWDCHTIGGQTRVIGYSVDGDLDPVAGVFVQLWNIPGGVIDTYQDIRRK